MFNSYSNYIDRRRLIASAATLGGALLFSGCGNNGAEELPTDITELSGARLSKAIKQRRIRCTEVMETYLQKIHRYNPTYNAIVSMVDDDVLMQKADEADRALERGDYWGWMHGMPHAVKDLADAKGLNSSYGSPIFANNVAETDSLPIARIRAQGAIFIGKTNAPEFGLGSNTYNAVHGTTGNAYDPALSAGGSSGGAAVVLALQLTPCADGSDMMGSLRNPAAFNNVVGFRPSQGRIPSPSLRSELFYDQLATDGPMGRDVEDTIRLMETMAGGDPGAPLSMRDPFPAFDTFVPPKRSEVRIGWMADYRGYLPTEKGVLDVCAAALNRLSDSGFIIEETMPKFDLQRLWETWLTLRHWFMSGLKPLYDDPETKSFLKPELIWEIEGGLGMSAAQISDAATSRSAWYRALNDLFEKYDILALPTAQVFPFATDIDWPSSISGKSMDTYHRWMEVVIGGTLAGLPVINLPAGFDEKGRPMGIQFMGPMGKDKEVLEFALAYEAVTDYLDKRPIPRN
ncbi:MAG: amidase [Pseudomonadota bacterium]